ncbi:MAG TPA: hypothetical protein VHT97_07605 [Acidimicrobiales bacterium]|nr:hypothetical protein [Acidimicrobiales bacterium]
MQSPADTGRDAGLSDELLHTSVWSDDLVAASGMTVIDMPFVTVGGGLGSYVMVDYLRLAGVPATHIRTLTVNDHPWQNYQYLLQSAQVTLDKRIRSDSSSCLDNIWGFPGYAIREAFGAKRPRDFVAPLWNVFTENILCDYWTPKSGQVFRSMQREADRIDYWSTRAFGRVHLTRRRHGGGYFTVLTPPDGAQVAYRSSFVHLAVGYPGLAFLPDLQTYRERFGDTHRVVNAYEPHEHVYEELNRRGGTVIVRGAGITASQVLDRLISDHEQLGNDVMILHLFRTYVGGPHGPSRFMRRRGGHGWAYQGFNWPKSTWGGQGKDLVRHAEGERRAAVLHTMGGTTTPRRRRWQGQLERGRRQGFYRMHVGEVQEVVPGNHGTIVTRLRPEASTNGSTGRGAPVELDANFVIDATGLEADIAEHTLLADLLVHSGAGRNLLGRLDVEPHFEVRGTRAEPGRLYAVGAATLGGYLAGVDTFLGLQIAALEVCDDLARQGFCSYLGPVRSTAQWWKWALDRSP